MQHSINHFTVVHLDTKPLSGREAQGDLVFIQTLLLLINPLVLMLTSLSVSCLGHSKPRFHKEARLLITEL